jgi:cell wall assembly regulator SMI1
VTEYEPSLDPAVLDRLEAQWRRDGASWVGLLQPGRSADEVTAALGQIGLIPPQQLTDWWGWHDGVSAGGWMGGGAQICHLDAALRLYAMHREIAIAIGAADEMDPNRIWPSWCLPIFGTGASDEWGIDCSEGPERGYIRFLPTPNVTDSFGTPIAASLEAMLDELARAYEHGSIRYDPERDSYEGDALAHWMWVEGIGPIPKRAGFS